MEEALLAWLRPWSPPSGPSAEQTSQAASSGGRALPLDPSRSARWFGWRDDGDGMGQADPGVRGARLAGLRLWLGYFGRGDLGPGVPVAPSASRFPAAPGVRRTGASAVISPAAAPATRRST